MPYVIVDKTIETDLDSIPAERTFTDRSAAYRACLQLDPAKQTLHVVYADTPDDRQNWRMREFGRFDSGLYVRTPWHDHDKYRDHFVHLSVKTPGKVAYTPDAESGFQDRQVTVNPGRYLEKFYPTISREYRAEWICRCDASYITLSIATTADEIETVYRNCKVHSCMGPDSHATFETHPTRVYGDSDLAVAFTGPIDSADARCVIWPDKMLYSRIYSGNGTLRELLESAGYSNGSMRGAHIRSIESGEDNGGNSGSLLMPYIDGIDRCELVHRHGIKGSWLKLGSGSIETSTTGGYTDLQQLRSCDRCNDEYEYDEDNDSGYCSSCEDSRQYCSSCEADTFGSDFYYSADADDQICEDCARQNRCSCFVCDDTWFEAIEFSHQEQIDRVRTGSADRLCRDCDETHRICRTCIVAIEIDTIACPSCQAVPRCTQTADLLADLTSPADPIL